MHLLVFELLLGGQLQSQQAASQLIHQLLWPLTSCSWERVFTPVREAGSRTAKAKPSGNTLLQGQRVGGAARKEGWLGQLGGAWGGMGSDFICHLESKAEGWEWGREDFSAVLLCL